MKSIGIIPARYASTRFPGKPLARLGERSLIQCVYERAVQTALDEVIVATDDARIYDHVLSFGGQAAYSRADHTSGTDRCAEVAARYPAEVVVNIQGDEPFFPLASVNELLAVFEDTATQIATLSCPISEEELIFDPNVVKVVSDTRQQALYFSRSPVPYLRDVAQGQWAASGLFRQHIGIYAFRASVLAALTQLPPGVLERAESLEQLRWLQAGYRIHIVPTAEKSIGIDTPADLARAQELLK